MKKICLVIHSLCPGGMERVMSELADFFCRQPDVQIHLILYGANPEIFYKIPPNLIVHQPDFKFDHSGRFLSALKRARYLRAQIKNIKPDAVLSFGEHWNRFVLLSLLFTRYPVYVADHGEPGKDLGFFQNFLGRLLYPGAAGVIVLTEKAKKALSKKFKPEKIKVIGNPIRRIRKIPTSHKANFVLSVGRLINTKHHDRMIGIFSKLDAPGWKLVIVGGNALKQNNFDYFKKIIEQQGLADRIVLTGRLSNVEEYYLKSKIFVFTGSSEGFPMVIGEALSVGLPVVSYDCVAGPSEMITDGENGFLVPVFDDELFQKRLQLLIDNEELRRKMAAKAPGSVEKYSLEEIGQSYLDFMLRYPKRATSRNSLIGHFSEMCRIFPRM